MRSESPLSTKKAPSHWPISILTSLSAIVNMFVPLVMVRFLPREDIGVFKVFFLYVIMMPTVALVTGLTSGLAYWAGQGPRGLRAIQQSNACIFGMGIVFSLLCLGASPWIADWFKWPHVYGIYFAAATLGAICLNFLEESSIVTGKIWFGAIFMSSAEIIRSCVIVLTAWLSHDLGTILLAYALVSLVKVTTSLAVAHRRKLILFAIDREVLRGVWKYSFPVSTAWLFGIFSKTGDQVILSNVLAPASFAVYAIGCLSVPPLQIIEQSVTRVMIPQLSKAFADRNPAAAARHYRDAVEQLAWLLIPAVAGLIVFARPIIELLFTHQYSESAAYLRWFALSYLFLMVPDDSVPRARGEGTWILRTFILFAPIPMTLCYTLGVKYGAFGALGGILFARALWRLYALYYIKSSTGWKLREFLPLGDIAIFAAVSAALGFLCLSLEKVAGGGLLWFLSCGLLFVALYFPLSLLLLNLRKRRTALKEGQTGRILLFSQHLRVGGLERLVLNLGQTLQKNPRWKVYLFSHDSDENAQSYTTRTLVGDFLKSDIPVDALKKKPGFSFATLYRLVRNIYRNHIDVIHSHDMGTLIYAVLANFLALGRVRIVHTQHSFVHLNDFKRNSTYERVFTMFVDTLTVVNESLVKPYVDLGVPEKRIQVINNGVAFIESPTRERADKLARRKALVAGLPDGERGLLEPFAAEHWILYLARFHSVKGQRNAAALWRDLSPEVRRKSALVLVGPEAKAGERAEVLRLFEGAPDRDRVIFLDGTKTPQEWLACADLFLSCSKFEGMPLGPLEAIGSGLPAVLSAIEGHGFLDKVSLQYPLDAPAEGARQIERVFENPAFGSAGYYAELWRQTTWIRDQYSLDAMADRYARFYAGKS